jgi:hypothetical protein
MYMSRNYFVVVIVVVVAAIAAVVWGKKFTKINPDNGNRAMSDWPREDI